MARLDAIGQEVNIPIPEPVALNDTEVIVLSCSVFLFNFIDEQILFRYYWSLFSDKLIFLQASL